MTRNEQVKRKPGRPPTVLGGMRRVCVQLDQGTLERARLLGDGNLSAGLRAAVARLWP